MVFYGFPRGVRPSDVFLHLFKSLRRDEEQLGLVQTSRRGLARHRAAVHQRQFTEDLPGATPRGLNTGEFETEIPGGFVHHVGLPSKYGDVYLYT